MVTGIIRDKKGRKTIKVVESQSRQAPEEGRFITWALYWAPCGKNTGFIFVLPSDDMKHSNVTVATNFFWD